MSVKLEAEVFAQKMSESHDPQMVLEIRDSPSENVKGGLPGTRQMKMKGFMVKLSCF